SRTQAFADRRRYAARRDRASMSWAKSRKTEPHAKSNNIFHRQATGPRARKCASFTSAMNDQVLDEPALARFPILRRAALSAPAGKKEYHPSRNGCCLRA